MNARLISAAADLICRSMKTKQTAAGIAADLDAAGMLQSPGIAAELERLRTAVPEANRAVERAREGRAEARAKYADAHDDLAAALGRASGTEWPDLIEVAAANTATAARAEGQAAEVERLRARVAELEAVPATVPAAYDRSVRAHLSSQMSRVIERCEKAAYKAKTGMRGRDLTARRMGLLSAQRLINEGTANNTWEEEEFAGADLDADPDGGFPETPAPFTELDYLPPSVCLAARGLGQGSPGLSPWQRAVDGLNALADAGIGFHIEPDGHISNPSGGEHIEWSRGRERWVLTHDDDPGPTPAESAARLRGILAPTPRWGDRR